MLLVMPAPNIRIFGIPFAASTSASSGSTNAPMGMTAIKIPMLRTRISSTRARMA